MAIYEILEEVMTKRDVTIADIARICNLPDSTVRGIVRRKQDTVALDVAFKLSDGLGVSLEKLNGMPEKEQPLVSGQTKEQAMACELFSQCYGKEAFSAVSKFLRLDEIDRARVVERIDTLLGSEKYVPVSKDKTARAV